MSSTAVSTLIAESYLRTSVAERPDEVVQLGNYRNIFRDRQVLMYELPGTPPNSTVSLLCTHVASTTTQNSPSNRSARCLSFFFSECVPNMRNFRHWPSGIPTIAIYHHWTSLVDSEYRFSLFCPCLHRKLRSFENGHVGMWLRIEPTAPSHGLGRCHSQWR